MAEEGERLRRRLERARGERRDAARQAAAAEARRAVLRRACGRMLAALGRPAAPDEACAEPAELAAEALDRARAGTEGKDGAEKTVAEREKVRRLEQVVAELQPHN